ncbi:MAG: hypothetical protein WD073_00090 [Xanthobacteraceae bacterium]
MPPVPGALQPLGRDQGGGGQHKSRQRVGEMVTAMQRGEGDGPRPR